MENSSFPYGTLLPSSLGSQFHSPARTLLYISIFPTSHPPYRLPSKPGSHTSRVLQLVLSLTMILHPQLEIQVLHRWATHRQQSWRRDPLLCTADAGPASTSQQRRSWKVLTYSGNEWKHLPRVSETAGTSTKYGAAGATGSAAGQFESLCITLGWFLNIFPKM